MKKIKFFVLSVTGLFSILIGGYFLLNLDPVVSNAQIKDQKAVEHYKKKASLTKNIYTMSDEELYKEFGDLSGEQLEESIPGISDSDKIVVLTVGGQLMGDGTSELVNYGEDHKQVVNVNTDLNAISIKDLKEFLNSKRNDLKQIKDTNSEELE